METTSRKEGVIAAIENLPTKIRFNSNELAVAWNEVAKDPTDPKKVQLAISLLIRDMAIGSFPVEGAIAASKLLWHFTRMQAMLLKHEEADIVATRPRRR